MTAWGFLLIASELIVGALFLRLLLSLPMSDGPRPAVPPRRLRRPRRRP